MEPVAPRRQPRSPTTHEPEQEGVGVSTTIGGEQIIPVGDAGVDPQIVRDEVLDVLIARYDLGDIIDVWPISGGYVNWSFGAKAVSKGVETQYFIRKYNRGATAESVRYEHALVEHLVECGFDKVAPVVRADDGESFVITHEAGSAQAERYVAVYGFLPGECKYSWCFDTDVTEKELNSCARTLAEYHAHISSIPPGLVGPAPSPGAYQGSGVMPRIMDLLPTLPPIYESLAARTEKNVFGRYLRENIDDILRCVRDATRTAHQLHGLPSLTVHSDFHAGNVKYRDGEVVALFDFDYARFDYRMFDIGHALHFFCFSWDPQHDGDLWQDKLRAFVREYQMAAEEIDAVGPLNAAELRNTIPFLHAGNIFTLDWDIRDFFAAPGRDPEEYIGYLQHNVRLMKTIDAKQDEIGRLVAEAARWDKASDRVLRGREKTKPAATLDGKAK